MDEGERERLAVVAHRHRWIRGITGVGWDALRTSAVGASWGRSAPPETVDVNAWALLAEVSR
ncbi:hypothetical protein [Mycolicibacterium palauense]|uniref:hypothetical protein n=1 Tax=Mycolicibacterium palauense TaxID=2034511 RepID=UPI000BFEDB48|nr:hypothetical protein [Mycolicibacterium palauense]